MQKIPPHPESEEEMNAQDQVIAAARAVVIVADTFRSTSTIALYVAIGNLKSELDALDREQQQPADVCEKGNQ